MSEPENIRDRRRVEKGEWRTDPYVSGLQARIAELESELEQARKDLARVYALSDQRHSRIAELEDERDGYRDALERITLDDSDAAQIACDALAGKGQT